MFSSGTIDVDKCRAVLKKAYNGHLVEKGVKMELTTLGGVETAIFTPEHCTDKNIVYYAHGGGLVTGDRLTAGPYASQLALETGCRVVSCSYRLAPEDPFPAGLDDTFAVYKALRDQNPKSKICVIGESGGAYLTLALALKAKQEDAPLPDGLVMNSVVADMSGQKVIRHDSPRETTVSVRGMEALQKLYAPDCDLTNPLISCIYADFKGLPPMRVVYDRDECLAVDSKAVIQKAKAAGVLVESEEYTGCFHAFTTTGKDTPESALDLKRSAAFMKRIFA